MGSKGTSSIKGDENLNEFEDLSNDLESPKDIEDMVELNEEIKGTIFYSDVEGDNVKMAVDVVVEYGDCVIPILTKKGIYKMSQEMDSREFSKDMAIFAPIPIQTAPVALRFLLRMVEHMGSAVQITTPFEVVGVQRKCCIMIESLKDFSSMCPIVTACLDA
ncbi:uncharacterized protein E5676_scaffold455G002100 [Cucumis melo var. makuwa]|uniref:Uncharacterized protein n=1 Tax=Cucumis melo var. makuwa TaxID=1194695 RepID=A0A5A7SYA7_CUCMM|nr:uncharacterized protein E6C27_scaffold285G002210 [Cucumis melo var. makuwa]TYK30981.1 uncharacterized protein E5676_scaffold455G002100 [Cucumis melo var. makuwa]